MVVVADDVHEYAVALKDTEEKIARCPARVSSYPLCSVVCRDQFSHFIVPDGNLVCRQVLKH